jgi:CheY-like chemotaxis protein
MWSKILLDQCGNDLEVSGLKEKRCDGGWNKMPLPPDHERTTSQTVARVLLADDDPASRLTLQTVLQAGGYRVDSAASAAEALGLMDEQEYELVLSDLSMESPEAGFRVIEHARLMPYRPATAIVTSSATGRQVKNQDSEMLIEPEDLPELLGQIALLISARATRRLARSMRHG